MNRNCQNIDEFLKREPDLTRNKDQDELLRPANVGSIWRKDSRSSQTSALSPNAEYLEQQRAQISCTRDLDLTPFSQPNLTFQHEPADFQTRSTIEDLSQQTDYGLYSPQQSFDLFSIPHQEPNHFDVDLANSSQYIRNQTEPHYSPNLVYSETHLYPAIMKHHHTRSSPYNAVFEQNNTDAYKTTIEQSCGLPVDQVKTDSPKSLRVFSQNVNSLSVSMPPSYTVPSSSNVAVYSPSYPKSPIGSSMSLLSPQRTFVQTPLSLSDDDISFGIPSTPLGSGETRKMESDLMGRHRTSSPIEPRRQETRFEEDMYTPRWVRGKGKTKEGWCDLCNHGGWFQLKNSAYWYHKQYLHGICNITGRPYPDPIGVRQVEGGSDALEVECGSCKEWISIGMMRATDHGKWGASWYRHAHKVKSFALRTNK